MSALELAQRDPVDNLTARWTEAMTCAKILLRDLERELNRMDELATILKDDHGVDMTVDLGPIGNQAVAARRDLEKQKPARTFELPR